MPSVYIPESITVHLGTPSSNASNVTVSFPDYIKNVASSEIYPTWPESALRANIYAQISFDQKYIHGRDIFASVNSIVDEIFNNYLRREGNVEPLFAQFCNGTTVTCAGLSQWGSVDLARQDMTP